MQIGFDRAKETEMPLGKHKGRTIEEVAATSEGLLYLDWLTENVPLYGWFKRALATYLADATVSAKLYTLKVEKKARYEKGR